MPVSIAWELAHRPAMSIAILILALLLCVAASAIVVRLARLPLPLTQIALGALVGLPSFGLHVELEPELFMLLFVPPLLFADGWRIPKREFFEMRERILALAFGLVLFTVFAVGWLLHWMIPQLPLAVAFSLAAVLSPTDAVAVSALAGRAGIPKRLMYVLQGEALMNDASGLTAFNFAIAAALTGSFSLMQASASFVALAVGGLALGTLLGIVMAVFQRWLSGWTQVQAQGTITLILLLPFAAYLLAEHLHVSGILAAMAAGMSLNLRGAAVDRDADVRIAGRYVWSMLEYLFHGVVFVLLGLQLPELVWQVLKETWLQVGPAAAVRLVVFALLTCAALIGARFVWVWAMLRVTHLYAQWRGGPASGMPQRRLIWAGALAGVRGAITLAGVLSVPLVMPDGSLFPARRLMIFVATTVILLSLLAAALGLPRLLRGLELEEDPEDREERLARLRACEAAIAAVAEAQHAAGGDGAAALAGDVARVIDAYQHRLRGLREDQNGAETHGDAAESQLHLLAMRAERAELQRLHREDQINDAVLNALILELDMREAASAQRARGASH
jgi:CPA1 family monovalent cation:H+ antiporter